MKRKTNNKIAKKIMEFLCKDYNSYNILQISKATKINWETVKNFVNMLVSVKVIIVDKDVGNQIFYRWNVVPLKFFNNYKEEKEKYIELLENRLFELKNKKYHD